MDVTLETARLILRPPRAEDAPRIARYMNNFRVAGNLARVPYPYFETDARTWIQSWRPDRRAAETGFSLELPGEGVVGNCGFHLSDGVPVVGYWLGEPFWNRGLMTEALRAVLAWYFEVTDEPSIASGVFHFNKASLAIQHKVGFVETGISRMHCLARKQEVRHIDTELTRARFAERHSQRAVAREAS